MSYKVRQFLEHNYKAIYTDGKTLRLALDPDNEITELDFPEFYDVKVTNKCFGGCTWCLSPESLINTPNGYIKIKDLKTGDLVYVYDNDNNLVKIRPIDQYFIKDFNGTIIKLVLESGKIIHITKNHDVFTNRGWIKAGDLLLDDELLNIDEFDDI